MVEAKVFGLLVQSRRQAMEMSLNNLTSRMGGSPGASFLSKIESGKVTPTREVAEKLADALSVPSEVMLNAAGHAVNEQEKKALDDFRGLIFEQPPVLANIPVWTQKGPAGSTRSRMLRRREEVRIIDLTGPANDPFIGEVIFSLDREPVEGVGVVAAVDGGLGAWTWHEGPKGAWIENGRKEPRSAGYKIEGVIIRVMKEMDLS